MPLGQAVDLRETYCKKGVTELFTTYPGNHVTGNPAGLNDSIAWIADRFDGARAPTNCDEAIAEPPVLPAP